MKNNPNIISIRPLYLAKPQACEYLSISEATLEKMVRTEEMPPPRKVSSGRVAWLVTELDAWGLARPVSDLLPPKNCGVRRAS